MNDDDAKLWVKFLKRAVHLKARSEREGRQIYEDREFISIVVPGSADEIVREIREEDKVRFAAQWNRYLLNQEQVMDGTPIDEWPALTASQREELKYLKGFTVEQIAGLSDAQCQKLGAGYMSLRVKAGAFLDLARDTAAVQRYAAENAELRAEIEALKEAVAEMKKKGSRAA